MSIKRKLKDDYSSNSGDIQPIDVIVQNDYEYNGRSNPHQAFGYLRTPQIAQVITNFLDRDKPRIWIWFSDIINRRIQQANDKESKSHSVSL